MEDFLFLILEMLTAVAPIVASFWLFQREGRRSAIEETAEALRELDGSLTEVHEKLDELLGRKEPTTDEVLREVLEAVKKKPGGRRGVGNK